MLHILKTCADVSKYDLVPVGLRLVGSLDRDANVVGLLLGEGGELGSEAAEVKPGDLLVENLGKKVNVTASVLAAVLLLPELKLGESLVGEGTRHDEGRVSSGATKVE